MLSKEELEKLRAQIDLRLLYTDKPNYGGYVVARCVNPAHVDKGRPNMAVYKGNVYCFRCGFHEDALAHIARVYDLDIRTEFRDVVNKAKELVHSFPPPKEAQTEDERDLEPIPESVVQAYYEQLWEPRNHSKVLYLRSRGLTDDTIHRFRLGYAGNAYVIPILDDTLRAKTLRFRRDDTVNVSGPKYWGLSGRNGVLLFNEIALSIAKRYGRWFYLTEGEFDAMILSQLGYCAGSLTNGNRALKLKHVEQFKGLDVVLVYDQDPASHYHTLEVAQLLAENGAETVRVARWNPALGKDVTDLHRRSDLALHDALRRAPRVRL